MTRWQRFNAFMDRAVEIIGLVGALIVGLTLLGISAVWLAAVPLFRPIVSVGFALFVCGLMALLFDAIRTVYLGLKGRAK